MEPSVGDPACQFGYDAYWIVLHVILATLLLEGTNKRRTPEYPSPCTMYQCVCSGNPFALILSHSFYISRMSLIVEIVRRKDAVLSTRSANSDNIPQGH